MIETSIKAWVLLLLVITLSSTAGVFASRSLRWSARAQEVNLPNMLGIALGPFTAGLGAILALSLLPGQSHSTHIIFVVGLTVGLLLLTLNFGAWRYSSIAISRKSFLGERILFFIITLWIIALLINSIFLPLMQNDSLEYATVARILYDSRTLADYPAINPIESVSGFFGPWTHPPLYVALGYFGYVIQGHADSPGLMRLISPWFAVTSTLLVVTIGSLSNKLTGLVSGIIFLSTPLYFAGADSALIDPLPILGLLLSVGLLLGLGDVGSTYRGVLVGGGLSLALLTHSQAILFIPLIGALVFAINGLRHLSKSVVEVTALALTALLLGSWPYLRNLLIFGTLVSDNPPVFALPELAWSDYFAYARGLDNSAAIVQYGLFKGWFSFEAYGWSFWIMTLGAVIGTLQLSRQGFRRILLEGSRASLPVELQLFYCCGLVVFLYLGGVALSVLIGLDLMIKNERYMLVILPFVSVLAGYGVQTLLRRSAWFVAYGREAFFRRESLLVIAFFVGITLLIQFVVLGIYYRWRHIPEPVHSVSVLNDNVTLGEAQTDIKSIFERRLKAFPSIEAMFWMRDHIPRDALVLSLRPADMYYSQRKMVSYLDNRLLPLYAGKSPVEALKFLNTMGISYLHSSDYALPVAYNSVLDELISNPSWSELLYSVGGTQVFRLRGISEIPTALICGAGTYFSPGDRQWSRYPMWTVGGRKAMEALGLGEYQLAADGFSDARGRVGLFHRDFSTMLANGIGRRFDQPNLGTLLSVKAMQEYKVAFDIAGDGYIKLWMFQFDRKGRILRPATASPGVDRISEIVLTNSQESTRLSRRFVTLDEAHYVRFGIEHMGHSFVRIEQALLAPVQDCPE